MNTVSSSDAPEQQNGATMQALRALGFTDRPPEFASTTLGYDMGGWEIRAQEMVNLYLQPIVQLSGVLNTGRVLAEIDIQLPQTLTQPEKAAAFLVFSLTEHRPDLGVLPEWWTLGEDNLDLHPLVQERKQRDARMKAFQARPHCVMALDHARLFRRQLRDVIKDLPSEQIAVLTFDGQVLRVTLPDKEIAVLAEGEAWRHSVSWPLRRAVNLPGRFKHDTVTLGVFNDQIDLEDHRYSGASVSEPRLPIVAASWCRSHNPSVLPSIS